jgi:dimethylhistidine N-methyltransferase
MAIANTARKDAIHYHEHHRTVEAMAAEVHAGLSCRQKYLPPKFFYDKHGSELFDTITRLPEYYPTRTEIALLRAHAAEMAKLLGLHGVLLELGSGSSIKIRLLLEALRPRVYVPMDISRQHLIDSSRRLAHDYPWLTVHAACVDYSQPWDIPDFGPGRHNAFFPGSSIGNFDPAAARRLLSRVRQLVGADGGLLIGVDLQKDVGILERAYNDAQGVTAEFNLNMLTHLNRRLSADFDPGNFVHRAVYNAQQGRIEMHLECTRGHSVHIDGNVYRFHPGETIHTENSYKYSVAGFHELAAGAGFEPVHVWTDKSSLFSIHYLSARV